MGTTLPLNTALTGLSVTESAFRAAVDAVIAYLTDLAGTNSDVLAHIGTTTLVGDAATPAAVPLIVKGAAAQTGDLQQWQSTGATVLSKVDKDGKIYAPADGLNVGTSQLCVVTSGRIGLGTASPLYDLHLRRTGTNVNVTSRLQSDLGYLELYVSGSSAGGPASLDAGSSLTLRTAATDRLTIGADGKTDFKQFASQHMRINAQTDDNQIIHKYAGTAPTGAPLAALVRGELWIDDTNKLLYTKDSTGALVSVGGSPAVGGSFLPLDGSANMTGALTMVSHNPDINVRYDGSSATARFRFRHVDDTAGRIDLDVPSSVTSDSIIDLSQNFLAVGATNNALFRFFRYVNTTGAVRLILCLGDGSGTSVGGLEVVRASQEIKGYGSWFIPTLRLSGSWDAPLQLGVKRIWNNAANVVLYKDNAAPTSINDGQPLVPTGTYIPPTYLTAAGNFNVTVPAGASAVYVYMLGGGGAGGGVTSAATNGAAGGGGGGSYLEALVSGLGAADILTATIGAGGAGASGNDGATGGDTKLIINPAGGDASDSYTLMTARGGVGGSVVSAAAGITAGGAGGATLAGAGSTIVLSQAGFAGSSGVASTSGGTGGFAGGLTHQNGSRGTGGTTAANGPAATGYGHGGAGALNLATGANRAGGGGAAGYVFLMWI